MPEPYPAAIDAEKRIYRDQTNVHDLPAIFHYWSEGRVAPLLRSFGFNSPDDFFLKSLLASCRLADQPAFASIGSGNCDLEVRLARGLLDAGHRAFTIECLDLNPDMLDRGRTLAREAGVEGRLIFTEADLNAWQAPREYHAILANQSLHHILNLENLFAAVRSSLAKDGIFAVSDMIGRNGHLRWPEALAIVYEFWTELPPSYRMNTRLERYEEIFEDWDSSVEGFEGIRSQDILPLLVNTFEFRLFIPFANAIDVFTDRTFGYHFDPAAEWDRDFIDRVHARDVFEMERGAISPTHMIAVMGNEARSDAQWPGHLSPSFCIRPPDRVAPDPVPPAEPFPRGHRDAAAWRDAGRILNRLRSRATELDEELRKRTAWALDLDRELTALRDHAARLERLWLERTRWALDLESELRLAEAEAARRAERANRLEFSLSGRVRNGAGHFARRLWRRLRKAASFS